MSELPIVLAVFEHFCAAVRRLKNIVDIRHHTLQATQLAQRTREAKSHNVAVLQLTSTLPSVSPLSCVETQHRPQCRVHRRHLSSFGQI